MELTGAKVLCRLCLEISVNYQPLEGFTSYKLKFILPIIDLDLSCDPKICKKCFTGLLGHYLFKSMCVDNNEPMHNFLELELLTTKNCTMSIHMRNEEKRSKCGLCHGKNNILRELKGNVDKMLRIMLARCLPDLDDMVPAICEGCLESLKVLFRFINGCMDTEAKIKNYCCLKGLNGQSKVNLYDVVRFTRSPGQEEDVYVISDEDEELDDPKHQSCDVSIKSEPISDGVELMEDIVECEVVIKPEPEIDIDEGPHRNQIETYAELLTYDQHSKHSVENSVETSVETPPTDDGASEPTSEPAILKTYKCSSCNYITRHKTRLRLHNSLYHKDSSSRLYKCMFCSYRTTSKYIFWHHKRCHLDDEESGFESICSNRQLCSNDSPCGVWSHNQPHGRAKREYKRKSRVFRSRKKCSLSKVQSMEKESAQEKSWVTAGGESGKHIEDITEKIEKQDVNEKLIEKNSIQIYLNNQWKSEKVTKIKDKPLAVEKLRTRIGSETEKSPKKTSSQKNPRNRKNTKKNKDTQTRPDQDVRSNASSGHLTST